MILKKETRKKTCLLIFVLSIAICIVGCSKQLMDEETTTFDSLQVEEQNGTIISEGKVKIHKTEGVLLTIEAGENTNGTFNIRYTKNKGALQINLNDELVLSLGNGTELSTASDNISVELKKGTNDFILSGEDCSCEFTVSLTVPDKDQIISFGSGTLK